jgi:hypothetical protein
MCNGYIQKNGRGSGSDLLFNLYASILFAFVVNTIYYSLFKLLQHNFSLLTIVYIDIFESIF